jgi:hypothetical protein
VAEYGFVSVIASVDYFGPTMTINPPCINTCMASLALPPLWIISTSPWIDGLLRFHYERDSLGLRQGCHPIRRLNSAFAAADIIPDSWPWSLFIIAGYNFKSAMNNTAIRHISIHARRRWLRRRRRLSFTKAGLASCV